MTVISKDIVWGLDDTVKNIQNYLDVSLPNDYGWLGSIDIYGLIQPTLDKDNNVVPEFSLGTGKKGREYSQIFINDKIAASIGFYEIDRDIESHYANLQVIVTLQIDRITGADIRENEKLFLQFENALFDSGLCDNPTNFKKGIQEVFSDFYTEPIKHRDMHEWLVFSMDINVSYSNDLCPK